MDEFERIAMLEEIFGAAHGLDGVEVGIGDDAAVLSAPEVGERRVLSVDACVEGVHFERGYASEHDLGYRAVTAAASDLAAMGAAGDTALISLILPAWLDDRAFANLARGIAEAAKTTGSRVVGGNLSKGDALSITTTVIGCTTAPLLRRGARVGDGVFVTGAPGERALGLRFIQAGEEGPAAAPFVHAWRRPTARIMEGVSLRGVATAGIDVSDGLAQDLEHLCAASGVKAQLDLSSLPISRAFVDAAKTLDPQPDPLMLALYGGEDYELLYTAPVHNEVAMGLGTLIGRIVSVAHPSIAGPQVTSTTGPLPPGHGFDHFTS